MNYIRFFNMFAIISILGIITGFTSATPPQSGAVNKSSHHSSSGVIQKKHWHSKSSHQLEPVSPSSTAGSRQRKHWHSKTIHKDE